MEYLALVLEEFFTNATARNIYFSDHDAINNYN